MLSSVITEEQFLYFHREGLIPGPDESEEEFLRRATYCLKIDEALEDIPFSKDRRGDSKILEEAHHTTKKLFGIAPTWIPIYFSNHSLAPWHGGCAWIVQLQEQSPITVLFQLRKKFQTKKSVGGYTRPETLAHELAHVGRMAFEEPKFEEVLAYRTSSSPLRRWLGPIVQSSRETLLIMMVLVALLLLDGFSLFGGHPILLWPKTIPLALIALALIRLSLRHRTFRKSLSLLEKVTPHANLVIFCLTDREIGATSKMSEAQYQEYASAQHSPRWELIKLLSRNEPTI